MADKDIIPETPAAPPQAAPDVAPAQAASPEPAASPAESAGASIAEAAAPAAIEAQPSLLQRAVAERDAKDAKPVEKPADKTAEAAKVAEPAKPDAKAEPAKDADKPAEAKPAEAAKPAEGDKPTEAKSLEPVEYKYTLPETLKLDDATKTNVHKAFDAFRADQTNPQPLIDLHNQMMTDYAKQVAFDQRKIFNETRKEWNKQVMADPEIGGSGHNTAMGAIARMRDLAAPPGSLEPRKFDDGSPRLSELDEFLETTGAGDHPVFLKMLHNFARFLDEPAVPPPNPRPTKIRAPRGNGGSIYSHPSSANMGK